jgi:SAM-dependent methyltransferase
MNCIKVYIEFIRGTLKSYSICRIYQLYYFKKIFFKEEALEFGEEELKKSFLYFSNLKDKKIFFSNNFNSKKKNFIRINLEKKNKTKKKFKNIVIFNVLEHIFDTNNAILEIKKMLKKNGNIVLSTPFIYRYHGAPNDYNRYTMSYLEKILILNKFKLTKKINCGTGPFLAGYSLIFDYVKRFPLLPIPILISSLILDKFLSLFQKTKMNSLYPICIFIIAKKID